MLEILKIGVSFLSVSGVLTFCSSWLLNILTDLEESRKERKEENESVYYCLYRDVIDESDLDIILAMLCFIIISFCSVSLYALFTL